MLHHDIKDSTQVKEWFCLGSTFDPKEVDREVPQTHSYEELPLYLGLQWSEVKSVRRGYVS